jgi:hypothetical protein
MKPSEADTIEYMPIPKDSSSAESRSSLQLKMQIQQCSYKFFEWRPILILAWVVHFLASICVLCFGTISNHGERKYIPINVEEVEEDCYKGFVDVFSPSMDSPGAFVCCSDSSSDNPLICNSPVRTGWTRLFGFIRVGQNCSARSSNQYSFSAFPFVGSVLYIAKLPFFRKEIVTLSGRIAPAAVSFVCARGFAILSFTPGLQLW